MLLQQTVHSINLIGRDVNWFRLDGHIEKFMCMKISLCIRYISDWQNTWSVWSVFHCASVRSNLTLVEPIPHSVDGTLNKVIYRDQIRGVFCKVEARKHLSQHSGNMCQVFSCCNVNRFVDDIESFRSPIGVHLFSFFPAEKYIYWTHINAG